MFENITHIIFDLDGLLIDSEPLWKVAEENALQKYGKKWQLEIARQHIGVRMDEAAAVMVKGYQIDVSPETLAALVIENMLLLIASEPPVMPGAAEVIQQFYAAGRTLAIASSSSEPYIRSIVNQLGWSEYIAAIASGYNVPKGKPAPDVYLEALRMLNTAPENCLAFEDSVNGTKAAKAAHIRVCAIPGHDFSPSDFEGIADAIYPSLHHVLEKFTPEFGTNLPIE